VNFLGTNSLPHFDAILGQTGSGPPALTRYGDIDLLTYAEAGQVNCVSVGLADKPIKSLHPTELVCTVLPGQEGAALHMLEVTIAAGVDGGFPLVLGSVLRNDSPLLARTEIHGALLTTCLWKPELDLLKDDDQRILLHVIGVLPLTGPELLWIAEHGSDAFDRVIESATVDLMDVTRPSAL